MSQSFAQGDALLVVDVQRDFCPGGGLPVKEGDTVVPVLNRWLEAAEKAGIPIFVARDWHPSAHISFKESGGRWPPHCVQDTPGAAFHPELRLPRSVRLVTKGARLDKDQLSAFDDTGLAFELERLGIRRLWVGGLTQEICVRLTVLDALRAGFAVHVIAAGTRPIEPEAGRQALVEMERAGAKLEQSLP